MRPSLTTLAGMTLAAGSIAIGAGLVGGNTASAQIDPVRPPVVQIDVAPSEPFALEPMPVGIDAEVDFVNAPDEVYNWLDGDSCPPCGMG